MKKEMVRENKRQNQEENIKIIFCFVYALISFLTALLVFVSEYDAETVRKTFSLFAN